jgi:hypothetical protein
MPRVMMVFDAQDPCQRGFAWAKHSMAGPVERSEGFEQERLDRRTIEEDR